MLGAANLTGFVGAAIVASIGMRFGRFAPLVLSLALQLVCLWLLRGRATGTSYLVIVGAMALAWNITNPFQLGLLAAVDVSGRALALSATVIGIGLAAGPVIAAFSVSGDGYTSVLALSAVMAVVSMLLVLPALLRRQATAIQGR